MDEPDVVYRVRRTELVTPATSIKMMRKALLEIGADEVIFDLEDSVPVPQKSVARKNIVQILKEVGKPENKTIAFRINSLKTRFWSDDLEEIVGSVGNEVDCVVVPKVDRPEEVRSVEEKLNDLEGKHGVSEKIGLEAMIETAEGLLRCGDIAFSSKRLESLIFGPGDYAASIGMHVLEIGGMVEEYPGHIWHYPLFVVRNASAAAGLQAIDGPYAQYNDLEGFVKAAKLSRSLGFDGKWVIHPNQVEPCNKIYTPTREELEKARKILMAYEESVKAGVGATTVDGFMVDDATIRIAEKILAFEKFIA